MKQYTQNFNVNGIIMAVHSNQELWLQELLRSISAPLAEAESQAELIIELLEMEDHEIEEFCPLPGDEYRYEAIKLMLDQPVDMSSYQREDQTWQEIGGYARILADYKQGRGAIYRRRERQVSNPFFADSFFAVNLMQKVMTCRQFYTIHASCAEVNGQGVIITGPGGRGKSTSGYALARKGHPFLNDEKILLKLHGDSYRACSLTDIFKIRQNAIDRFFPELAAAQPIYRPDEDEYCFKTSRMPGMQMAVECNADILLILKQVDQPGSQARLINPARAVGELFPVTLNPRSVKSNAEKFDFLTDFLQQATCYQIDFGYDMDKFAQLVGELVSS